MRKVLFAVRRAGIVSTLLVTGSMLATVGSARVVTHANGSEVFEFSLTCVEKGKLHSERSCVAVVETSEGQAHPKLSLGMLSEYYKVDYEKAITYFAKYGDKQIAFANATVLTCQPKSEGIHPAQLSRHPEHVMTLKAYPMLIGEDGKSGRFSPDRSVIKKRWPVDAAGKPLPACSEGKSRAFR